jgi:tetratricopeptide (TPR) repeat protein
MSNQPRVQPPALEPFEDRIDFLFRELELSIKWQRPSILFAVYISEYVHSAAEADLEYRLVKLDQKVIRISVDNKAEADIFGHLSEFSAVQNAIFFIHGLRWGSLNGADLYQDLNNQREFFVEKKLRLVFWLTEKEVVDLANKAPDFWAFRHRVIEFNDSPTPELIYQNAADTVWQGTGEYTDPDEDLDAKISFRESLLTNLPEINESAAVNGNLLLTLGILHWRKGDYEKASEFLKAALDVAIEMKDKTFAAECFNAFALVETGMGRPNEAIQAYQRAIQLAPALICPWNNLGILYTRLGRNDEALAAFKKAIEIKPGDAVSWNGLGDIYMKLEQPENAIRSYLKAIEFTPNFQTAWCGLGNAYFSANRIQNAFKAFQKSFTLNRKSTQTIIGLARILNLQGRENNAIQAYEAALNIDPRNAAAWNELGKMRLKTGDREKAIAAFEKAIELAPQNAMLYSSQAETYLELGLHLEAIPLFEKSLSLMDMDDDKAFVWNRLGDAFRQIGDYNRAVSAYRAADEFSRKSDEAAPDNQPEPIENNVLNEAEEKQPQHAPEFELPAEAAVVQSSLDSKEPRIESAGDSSENAEEISAGEGTVQVLDGDHLIMLDKTLTEIEELLSRQNGMAENEAEKPAPEASGLFADEDTLEDEKKDALEWNELGNARLVAGEYDEAIFAYTRAIEMAPDFNWPYIKNLAMAYYQKGRNRQEEDQEDSNVVDGTDDSGSQVQDLSSMHELHNLSTEIFSTGSSDNETDAVTTTMPAEEEYFSLDSSSIVEPFTFDVNALEKDLLVEALQEDMEFNSGKIQEPNPASQELIEPQSFSKPAKIIPAGEEIAEVEISSSRDKFEVQPKNAYEWNELGNIYLKVGSNEKAIDSFKKAIEMDPSFGWAYSNLALALNHSKKFTESIPLYKKSIELLDTDKGKAISYNRLGDVYRHLNDQENAMKAYQMASDLDGNTKPILARARMVLLNNV